MLQEFVEAAGGAKARIVVVPTASALGPDVIDVYRALFAALGAASVVGVRPENREDADDPAFLEPLDDATGIFMTGGNQLKLAGVVTGTAFGRAVTAAHQRGAAVGGTSAGASILAEHMIAFGRSGATPRQRMSQLAGGLGLVQGAIVDQHFAQRNRYGRLLSLVAQSPACSASASTRTRRPSSAAVSSGGRRPWRGDDLRRQPDHVQRHYAKRIRADPGVRASYCTSCPRPRRSTCGPVLLSYGPQPPAAEIAELEAAEADLRKLAKEIAAEGVSPRYYEEHKRRGSGVVRRRPPGRPPRGVQTGGDRADHGRRRTQPTPTPPQPDSERMMAVTSRDHRRPRRPT